MEAIEKYVEEIREAQVKEWAEYKYELSFTPGAAQYIQLRVTMRNNDAGA